MSLEQTGIPSAEQIRSKFPSEERMRQGRVAVTECYQRIPCNPCEASCPHKAITVGEDINNCPVCDENKCIGCGICLSRCPGLAILLVKIEGETAEFSVPYEFCPLPVKGQQVKAVDRAGAVVCDATVTEVLNPKSFDRTPVVRFTFPAKYLYEVRNFKLEA